jgi:hypothetical protein
MKLMKPVWLSGVASAVMCAGVAMSTALPYELRTPHGNFRTRIKTRLELAWGMHSPAAPAAMTVHADGGEGVCDGDESKHDSCYDPSTGRPGPCICWPGGCASIDCYYTGAQSRCNRSVMGEPCWGCATSENEPCL